MLNKVEATACAMTITPDLASSWLSKQGVKQRRVSPATVADYARAMAEGRWCLNGEAIKISRHDSPLDGQHRLRACVASGCSFQSFVVFGLDPETFDRMDIGRKRTAADILGIEGYSNVVALAGAVRWVMTYRTKSWTITNIRMSTDEVRQFLVAEPGLEKSVSIAQAAKSILAPSPAGALHYLFAEKDASAADLFFKDLAEGSGLVSTDPVWVLRERLIKDRLQKSRLVKEDIFLMCIKAWLRRRSNDTAVIAKGSISRSDGTKKSYPKI